MKPSFESTQNVLCVVGPYVDEYVMGGGWIWHEENETLIGGGFGGCYTNI